MAPHLRQRASLLGLFVLLCLAACRRADDRSAPSPGPGGPGDGGSTGLPATALVSIGGFEALEGDSGTTSFTFQVSLSQPLAEIVSARYATQDGSARSSGASPDFEAKSGQIFFEPGATLATVEVLVNGDAEVESDESFRVVVWDVQGGGAKVGQSVGVGRIENDDHHRITVRDVARPEGDFGSTWFDFPVELWPPMDGVVTLAYEAGSLDSTGDAESAADFDWRRGEIVLAPGVSSHTIRVLVHGDLAGERDEQFRVKLFPPSAAEVVLEREEAIGTILDDDEPTWLDAELGAAGAFEPELAGSPEVLCALWHGGRESGGRLWLKRSRDGGLSWSSPPVRVDRAPDDVPTGEGRLCVEGQTIYVVWRDARDGAGDIRFNRSVDGGTTWLAQDRRVDTDPAGQADSREPSIACSGANVYVLWEDHRGGAPHLRFNSSADGGLSWQANDLRIDDGGLNARSPALAVASEYVYVVWSDERNGAADVFFDSSSDGGIGWRPADVRIDRDAPGAARSFEPRIAVDGARVYVVWLDDRNGHTGVYFDRSLDGGDHWDVAEQRLDNSPMGMRGARHARVACHEYSVIVAWEDDRNGLEDVYLSSSQSAGLMWRSNMRVSRGEPGASRSVAPELAFDGSSAFVLWRDSRKGGWDLFANRSCDAGITFGGQAFELGGGEPVEREVRSHRIARTHDGFGLVWTRARASDDAFFRSLRVH